MAPRKPLALAEAGEQRPVVPIVALGASAGGLAALEEFFTALPPGSGLAFVVIVHLAPDKESSMDELLQRHTSMPAAQVTAREQVQPNHLYVIPPNKSLSFSEGELVLSDLEESRARHSPIDFFFRSLGALGEHAAGIILSGTGTDGTVGLKAIKEAGGVVMAQDPEEATYPGMPESAIGTGLVDAVLPADELAQKVAAYFERQGQVGFEAHAEEHEETLQKLFGRLRAQTGHNFSGYRRSTMLRRIARRMHVCQVEQLSDYLELLHRRGEEVELLLKDFLISVTNFFRDAEVWEGVREKIIPQLFQGKSRRDEVRVWVAGCATGEEAYTTAMLLLEHAETLADPPDVQVFATDIDEAALAEARKGRYPAAIGVDVSEDRLKRYFIRDGDHYCITEEVRERIMFAPHNLLNDPPFSKLDLVSCRNVLIYLTRELQDKLLDVLHYALRPSGFLLLGTAGTVGGTDRFQSVDSKHHVYQKIAGSRPPPPMPSRAVTSPARRGSRPSHGGEEREPEPLQGNPAELHQRLLEEQAPPSVVVDESYDIVHVSERAGRYLRHRAGEVTKNILNVVREDLRRELQMALYQAFHHRLATSTRPVAVRFNGTSGLVHLIVRPGSGDGERQLALVIFAEVAEAAMEPETGEADRNGQVHLLEQELQAMKARFQETIEEHETSKEEMKAANEELQSVNEEYKSTAEELETSREELQSVNEELETVNAELEKKVEELSTANKDLKNLMASMDAGTLFLDRELRVKRYTPQVKELFNLQPIDLGRPISDLRQRVDYEELEEDARTVLRGVEVTEREVWDEEERCFLVRHRPYRSMDEHLEGVVITFVEITARKQAEEDLRQANVSLDDRSREVRSLAAELTLAEQRERQRIGFILHDHIQQLLFAIEMDVRQLRDELGEEQQAALSDLEETLNEVIEDTRTLSVELSPPVAQSEEGLGVVLEWLALHMQERHELAVDLNVEKGLKIQNDDLASFLFQVLRELLFNVVKHAEVDRVRLAVRSEDAELIFEVTDEGVGFDVEELTSHEVEHHMGLRGLERRLDLIGGNLEISSEPGEGTQVTITVTPSVRQEF